MARASATRFLRSRPSGDRRARAAGRGGAGRARKLLVVDLDGLILKRRGQIQPCRIVRRPASGEKHRHDGGPATVNYDGNNTVIKQTVVPAFEQSAKTISDALNNANPFSIIVNGKVTTADEIADITHHFDFKFTEGVAYPDHNYGGQTQYDPATGRYVSNMDATGTAAGYAAQGPDGVNYIELHEIAHKLQISRQFQQTQYSDFLNQHNQDPTGWSDSAQFDAVERFANDITEAIELQLHINVKTDVPHGY
ncbi:hypothetical protein [Sphingomonas morindae]|uniref:Uncharacterized protein n=1 Tax=Sphingomonas morindae TaxID=1541170 RepID=A0ABY4XAA9_9SPHN|nr:hypothetical protein [Sphingomonas morindae]USI73759.1 hypothetical protein LHA26_04625 [Sphingomonas morindae]